MFTASLWQKTAALPSFEPLTGECAAEVAVVGGGLCGLLTAYRLHEAGVRDIAVLEANTLCGGATAHTTAKISALQGIRFAPLCDTAGDETARRYASLCARAVTAFGDLAPRLAPDCDFTVCDSVLYARTDTEAAKLRAEHRALARLGFAPKLSRETELPFAVRDALWLPEQAAFHPLRFAAGLIRYLDSVGVRFYERSPVRYPASRDGVFRTPRGVLHADTVVLTSHLPLADRRGLYYTRLYQKRGYVAAFENAPLPRHLYRGVADGDWSFRRADRYLLVGCGSHPTGEEVQLPHLPLAQDTVTRWYPQSNAVCAWGNQDVYTPDGLPFVGPYRAAMPRLAPRVFFATGFNGWGMVGSMVAAGALARLVTESSCDADSVLRPHRRKGKTYAAVWCRENGRVLASFASGWLSAPPRNVHLLPYDEGGVFRIHGHRVGVYRDKYGKLHTVRPVCPHLGCLLQWNREEKTWDCPCHGSRFDVDGRVLNIPSPRGLKPSSQKENTRRAARE